MLTAMSGFVAKPPQPDLQRRYAGIARSRNGGPRSAAAHRRPYDRGGVRRGEETASALEAGVVETGDGPAHPSAAPPREMDASRSPRRRGAAAPPRPDPATHRPCKR